MFFFSWGDFFPQFQSSVLCINVICGSWLLSVLSSCLFCPRIKFWQKTKSMISKGVMLGRFWRDYKIGVSLLVMSRLLRKMTPRGSKPVQKTRKSHKLQGQTSTKAASTITIRRKLLLILPMRIQRFLRFKSLIIFTSGHVVAKPLIATAQLRE